MRIRSFRRSSTRTTTAQFAAFWALCRDSCRSVSSAYEQHPAAALSSTPKAARLPRLWNSCELILRSDKTYLSATRRTRQVRRCGKRSAEMFLRDQLGIGHARCGRSRTAFMRFFVQSKPGRRLYLVLSGDWAGRLTILPQAFWFRSHRFRAACVHANSTQKRSSRSCAFHPSETRFVLPTIALPPIGSSVLWHA